METSIVKLLIAVSVMILILVIVNVIDIWGKDMVMLAPKKVIKTKSNTYICPFCSKELEEDWHYCPRCGQMLSWNTKKMKPFKDVIDAINKKGGKK